MLFRSQVQVRNTGLARNTGMFAQDVTGIEDVMVTASTPWAMQTVNYSYSIYEDLFQSDRETIIREMQIREHDALNSMAELNEINLWSSPTGSTDTRPMGIPFWLQKDATTTVGGGFNGGDPSGWSTGRAGISSTTYPKWRNWTFGYTNPTTDDLVKKVKKALAFTNFMAPVPHPDLGFGKSEYQIFTTYRVQEPLERLAETRNQNLGSDVARYVGAVTIGGVPIRWVPYLEANDTTDPLYGVNFKTFRPYVKRGCDMRRHPQKEAPKQHGTYEIHIDNWMNYACNNLRYNFVGSTS